jgi:hypothetical protein
MQPYENDLLAAQGYRYNQQPTSFSYAGSDGP